MAGLHPTDRQTLDQTTQPDTEKNKKAHRTGKEFFCQRIWHIWFCPDTQSQRFAKPKEPSQPKPTHHPQNKIELYRKIK